jgi:uncharacterized protein (TIGR02271 family)
MAEHIVAVFESEAAAADASRSLQSAGIPSSSIRQYAGSEIGRQGTSPMERTATQTSAGGFWSWLFGESSSETTRSAYTHDAYDRRASAGNVVLSVMVDDNVKIHPAIAALEAHNPIDVDERSDDVAASGVPSGTVHQTGTSTAGQEFSSGDVAQAGAMGTAAHTSAAGTTVPTGRVDTSDTHAAPVAALSDSSASATTGTERARTEPNGEQVLSLAEEQLQVGKRTVDRGTTRIRRYVVEKPVEQNVTLHSERVTVERRQPTETTAAPGAFEERVVEVRETAEEPVVAKTAHIVEEVVVGREATERTETVKDTVRREEVEVTKDGSRHQ